MKRYSMRFAAAAALAAGMALAQSAAPAPAPGKARQALRAGVRRRLVQALSLTDAQKQQARTIFQQAHQSAAPLQAQLQQGRETLAAAVKANDSAHIQRIAASQGTLRGQLMAIRASALAQFYQVLTPDQRAKADRVLEKIRQRLSQRGSNG